MLMTPEQLKMSAHISDVSLVTCVYTPDEIQSSTVPVSITPLALFFSLSTFYSSVLIVNNADSFTLKY